MNVADIQDTVDMNPYLLSNIDNKVYTTETMTIPPSSLLDRRAFYMFPTMRKALEEQDRRQNKVTTDAESTIERAQKQIENARKRIASEGVTTFTANDTPLDFNKEYVAVTNKMKPIFKFIPVEVDVYGLYRDSFGNILEPTYPLLTQEDVTRMMQRGRYVSVNYDYIDMVYNAEEKLRELTEAFSKTGDEYDYKLVRNLVRETNDAITKI